MIGFSKGFSMKVVLVALLVGMAAAAAFIRFGLGEGPTGGAVGNAANSCSTGWRLHYGTSI